MNPFLLKFWPCQTFGWEIKLLLTGKSNCWPRHAFHVSNLFPFMLRKSVSTRNNWMRCRCILTWQKMHRHGVNGLLPLKTSCELRHLKKNVGMTASQQLPLNKEAVDQTILNENVQKRTDGKHVRNIPKHSEKHMPVHIASNSIASNATKGTRNTGSHTNSTVSRMWLSVIVKGRPRHLPWSWGFLWQPST